MKLGRIATAIVVGSLVVGASVPAVAAGRLDRTFSADGKATTNFTRGFDGAEAVAVQPDGKIVAVGLADGKGGRFALARYAADGSLDTSFGGDGRVVTDFTPASDKAFAVAIAPDGKIVAAGAIARFTQIGSRGRFALARYLPTGALDTSFGGDGRVTTDFGPGEDRVEGVAIRGGKILAVGSASFGCTPCARFALARYDDDGSLDTSFGGDGKVTTGFRLGGNGHDVAVGSRGRIVVAGGDSEVTRFLVAAYRPDGHLDPSFSDDGKVRTHVGRGEQSAAGVAIQANGRIVAAGYADMPHEFGDRFGPGRFAAVRFRADGSLDASWAGDGIAKTRFDGKHSGAEDVAIQADGKVVAVGHVGGFGGRFALVRYGTHGHLDLSFGGDGRVTTNFTRGEDFAFAVAIGGSGRLVVAGHYDVPNFGFAVARYRAR
jgi:uncharacterized delta-60 repeat protein